MGQRLESITQNCIPKPDKPKTRENLEKLGVVFGDMCESRHMINCTLPENWKILISKDRGDIMCGYLLDENNKAIAEFNYASKGYGDGDSALMSRNKNGGIVDIERCEMCDSDGLWYPKQTDKQIFMDRFNNYLTSRERGLPQSNIDNEREELIKLNNGYVDSIPEVKEANRDGSYISEDNANAFRSLVGSYNRFIEIEVPWM